jgi:MinD-like ATPase involved in chromosome partitioning or flagellar assembly
VAVQGDAGTPIMVSDPESTVSKAFLRLAEQVARAVGA